MIPSSTEEKRRKGTENGDYSGAWINPFGDIIEEKDLVFILAQLVLYTVPIKLVG